jgi:hypothetical protein
MTVPLILSLLIPAVLAAQRPAAIQQETEGSCSPAVVAPNGDVTITCRGLDQSQTQFLERIPSLLEQLLKKKKADSQLILSRLDEIILGVAEIQGQDPRGLTPEDLNLIASAVSAFPGQEVAITAQGSDGEAIGLAEQLKEALARGGARVSLMTPTIAGKPVFGLEIYAAFESPAAKVIETAILGAGVPIRGIPESELQDRIEIVVWPKRPQ